MADMATTVSSMEKRIKQVNAKEEQLFAKEKEHEMLVKAYIERKNEINEKKKSLDIQMATILQRECKAKELTFKAEESLKKVNEEKELIKSAQRCNQEMRDVNKVEMEKLSERIHKHNAEEKKIKMLQQGYEARMTGINEKERLTNEKLAESTLLKEKWTIDSEAVAMKLKELAFREKKCKEMEDQCNRRKEALNLQEGKLEKEKMRLKNLDRHLQQFGEDCETQRELNEEEDLRLKKEAKILAERKTCLTSLEKRGEEMKIAYEARMM